MKLPFLISVPHGGLHVPPEVKDICILSPEEIYADSDGGAAAIYYGLEKSVETFCSTDIARAIVDLNRAEDDFRKDGIIKTHTCYDVPVYREFPKKDTIEKLLDKYYRPYHRRLAEPANRERVKIGIDCHTMAAMGPPIGPDAGKPRPLVCLSNAAGTCPDRWLGVLAETFHRVFPLMEVKINEPFKGGYIIRSHSAGLPWLQLEISRTQELSESDKKAGVFEALSSFSSTIF